MMCNSHIIVSKIFSDAAGIKSINTCAYYHILARRRKK